MDTTNKYEALFNEKYASLNENQKAAVDTIDGPVMVVAGPGTGKTQTISLRIANILKQTQLDPENILCLTFTDSAVNTMRKRLLEIIGEAAYDIKIYTFHGFCNEVIQNHPEKFQNFGAKSEPLSDIDKFKIFSGIIDQLPYDSILKPFGNTESYIWELPKMISGLKRDNISIEQLNEAVRRNIEFFQKTQEIFKGLKAIHYRQLTATTFTKFINDLQASGFADFGFVNYLIKLIEGFTGDKFSQLRNDIYDAFEDGFTETITRKQTEFITVFRNYQETLRTEGKYDFDDMIQGVVQRFQSDKALLFEYQERYQYILVDEFQDTNSSQNEVIRLLGSFWTDPNIFVVGDDDQSIFRFQGASIENMIFFYNTYLAKIKVVSLTNNYRSQQHILDSARAVISHNGLQVNEMIPNLSKELKSALTDLPLNKIVINEYRDPFQEANAIAATIKELTLKQIAGKDIAIIYRDNNDAQDIIEALTAQKVPYRLEKGEDILDNEYIQQIISLLKYIVDPENAVTLFELLNYRFWGFNKIDLIKLFRFSYYNKTDYLNLLADEAKLAEAGIENKAQFTAVADKLSSWRQDIYNINALVFFNKIIRDSGFLDYILNLPEKAIILNKLSRLYREIKNFTLDKEGYNLRELTADLEIYHKYHIQLSDKLWGIDDSTAVRLMTAHGAKGMEFQHVFITKCQDKKWGSRSNSSKIRPPYGLMQNQLVVNENDEERRLFYVALTRAKLNLNISYSRYNAKQKEISPSKFILELPEELTEKHTQQSDDTVEAFQYLAVINSGANQDYTEQGRALLQNILSDFKLSVSNVISYRRCPRCFFFNTMLKVPSLMSRSSALGTAVHAALKQLLDTYKQSDALPPLDFLLTQFVSSLRTQQLEEKDFLDALKQGELLLSEYYHAKKDVLPKDSFNELNFKHSQVVVENVPLSGKIDRVDIIDNSTGELRVVDYKTGTPDNAGSRLSVNLLGDYYLQLVFYKLLLDNAHLIRGYVKTGRVEFLAPGKEKHEFVSKDFDLDQQSIIPVIDLIKSTYESIMSLDFERTNNDTFNACEHPEFHNLDWKI